MRLPDGVLVDFFNAHAQAGRGNLENEDVRPLQMAQLTGFVREARLPGTSRFVVGDFNTHSGAPDYELGGRIPSSGPELFLDRAPRFGELWRMLFGRPATTRLSDHPGYLATVRVAPAR